MAQLMRRVLAALAVLVLGCTPAAADPPGTLVIVGGGLQADNAAVWSAFIDVAKSDGPIVIVASSSAAPAASGASARDALVRHGVAPARIALAPLAVMDDPDTPDVDEARWSENANDPAVIAQLRGAAALWFTGGDQSRTTGLLIGTPALAAIREAHAGGAAIGGTSAGAALMSDPMIAGGDGLGPFARDPSAVPLSLGKGLGFLKGGMVDQHFGARGRLPRLTAALFEAEARRGFGIDEDTALLVQADGEAEVLGTGSVAVLRREPDAYAGSDRAGGPFFTGLRLDLLSHGDRIDLDTGEIFPAAWRKPTVGKEFNDSASQPGLGFGARAETLSDVIGGALLDTRETDRAVRMSLKADGRGALLTFDQGDSASGWWGRDPATGQAGYTVRDIGFDIRSYRIDIHERLYE